MAPQEETRTQSLEVEATRETMDSAWEGEKGPSMAKVGGELAIQSLFFSFKKCLKKKKKSLDWIGLEWTTTLDNPA